MQLNLKEAQQFYLKQQFIINREFWLLAKKNYEGPGSSLLAYL